jgi:TolA-binding protein
MRRLITLALFAVLLAVASPPAWAQIDSREGIALENEILELRQQLQQMQQQLQGLTQLQASTGQVPAPQPEGEGQAPPQQSGSAAPQSDVVAQLLVRVSSLEEQVRTLQGKLDDLTNTEQRTHDDLAKQIGDLAFKVNGATTTPGATDGTPAALPAAGAPNSVDSVPGELTPSPPPPPPPPVHHTPEQALKIGQAALARRDYDAAAAAAQEVLGLGHGPRFADAQYLLAHAEAGKHDYKTAAASFYAVYKAGPHSPRGAESLIGVANAFLGMGDKPHACETMVKFGVEFPRPDSALRGAAASVRKRTGC